jgi:hypothetical protein
MWLCRNRLIKFPVSPHACGPIACYENPHPESSLYSVAELRDAIFVKRTNGGYPLLHPLRSETLHLIWRRESRRSKAAPLLHDDIIKAVANSLDTLGRSMEANSRCVLPVIPTPSIPIWSILLSLPLNDFGRFRFARHVIA